MDVNSSLSSLLPQYYGIRAGKKTGSVIKLSRKLSGLGLAEMLHSR